jgi:hypothetical protein
VVACKRPSAKNTRLAVSFINCSVPVSRVAILFDKIVKHSV